MDAPQELVLVKGFLITAVANFTSQPLSGRKEFTIPLIKAIKGLPLQWSAAQLGPGHSAGPESPPETRPYTYMQNNPLFL